MTAPLREPFFLRGQRNVLARAFRISLAMGVIGGGAGLIGTLIAVVVNIQRDSSHITDSILLTVSGSAAIALATLAAIPYSRWLRQPSWETALRATSTVIFAAGPLLLGGTALEDRLDAFDLELEPLTSKISFEVPAKYILTVLLLWLAWSSAFVNRSWTWLAATTLSALSVPAWALAVHIVTQNIEFLIYGQLPPGGIQFLIKLSERGMNGGLYDIGMFSLFFAMLAIPWGLPFWWPLEDRYEPVAPQPTHVV